MPTNAISALLMTELIEWDKFRFNAQLAGLNVDSTNVFVEDGALCYARSLAVLHGAALHSSPRDTKKWMKFSQKSRKKIAKDFPGFIDGGKHIEVTDEIAAHANRHEPHRTYTGLKGEAARLAAQHFGWSASDIDRFLAESAATDEVDQEPLEAAERLGWTLAEGAESHPNETHDDPTARPQPILDELERKYGLAPDDE